MAEHTSNPSLVHRITRELRDFIDRTDDDRLPPIKELCGMFDAGVGTITAAAHALRDEGVLTFHQGRRMLIADRVRPVRASPRTTRIRAFRASLREAIMDGTYKVGEVLPKLGYFAYEKGISYKTIRRIFLDLVNEGLLHQQGKKWIVGPGADHTAPSARRRSMQPVIVFIVNNLTTWRNLTDNTTVGFGRFLNALNEEAGKFGVRILPVFTELDALPGVPHAGDIRDINHIIHRLDTRYLGAFVSTTPTELPGLRDTLYELCLLGRPVVWFDRFDLPDERLDPPITHRRFIRVHHTEETALMSGLRHIAADGHRRIGIPIKEGGTSPWRHERARALTEFGARMTPPITVHTCVGDIDTNEDDTRRAARLRALRTSGLPGIRDIIDSLVDAAAMTDASARFTGRPLNHDPYLQICHLSRSHATAPDWEKFARLYRLLAWTPALAPLVRDPRLTAIIALNDDDAAGVAAWLSAVGIVIPGDLSVLSFDNRPSLSLFPIDSVDFGFATLGYTAFHAILGDIPVKQTSPNSIACKAQVVTRGSVQPPRTHRIRAPLEGVAW
jgi:DNA-binding LacI/PurR family transcriptional regulator